MSEESTINHSNELIADLREEAAEFDAGVQNLFDELESVRASLQEKEDELRAREDRFNDRLAQMDADQTPIASSDSAELYKKFNESFARVEKEFATAVSCMELIPEMCDSDDAFQSQIDQLKKDAADAQALRVELEQDLTAERERSARLEASLAAAEKEVAQQQAAFEEEFRTLRDEIRRLGEVKQDVADARKKNDKTTEPTADSAEIEQVAKDESKKTDSEASKKSRSSRRSKRTRRRKNR